MFQYANYARVPAHFVIKVNAAITPYIRCPLTYTIPPWIPKEISPAMAAPMLCGGVTVFSPLKKYGAGTTAKDVGIVGIGGLVHMLSLSSATLV